MKTTQDIADRLVALCREGQWEQAQKELYHQDIISMEPEETGGHVTKGLDAILKKNEMWMNMCLEVHGWSVSEPLIADGYFCVSMTNDITLKNGGRVKSSELCVYGHLEQPTHGLDA